jgi:hypothetical protein
MITAIVVTLIVIAAIVIIMASDVRRRERQRFKYGEAGYRADADGKLRGYGVFAESNRGDRYWK